MSASLTKGGPLEKGTAVCAVPTTPLAAGAQRLLLVKEPISKVVSITKGSL